MGRRRAWLPHVLEAVTDTVGVLLLCVGVFYDWRQIQPGWITVVAISLIAGPKLKKAATAAEAEKRERVLRAEGPPEVQAALRISDIVRERGAGYVLRELEAAQRSLPEGREE